METLRSDPATGMSAGEGPDAFGYFITLLGGQYWGGFLFLALLNGWGAASYLALH